MSCIWIRRLGRNAVLATLALALHAGATAQAVQAALERPAKTVKAPERVALLAAAKAGARIVAVGERGVIIYSDDQGKTWLQAAVPTSAGLTGVRFADSLHGWAVGHGGTVLASVDGGKTWARQLDGVQAARLMLEDAKAHGDEQAVAEAERLVADGADKPLLDLHFADAKRGMVVGAYNLAFVTEDGGRTWQPISRRLPNPGAMHLYALRTRGSEILIAGEQGVVLYSSDGGASFQAMTLPYEGSYFTAALPANGDVIVAGLRGNAWRSSDRGATWSPLKLSMPVAANILASAIDAQGRVWISNQAGMLLRLADANLIPVRSKLPPLNDMLPLSGDTLLGVSMHGVVHVSLATQGAEP